jgi:hypothetical protein
MRRSENDVKVRILIATFRFQYICNNLKSHPKLEGEKIMKKRVETPVIF